MTHLIFQVNMNTYLHQAHTPNEQAVSLLSYGKSVV